MARHIAAVLMLGAISLGASAQSIPFIDQPLIPSAVKPGGAAFTLTVNGGGFNTGSVILWNGSPVTTTYVSATKLTANIPASKTASPESALISVSSGLKLVSNEAFLQVEAPRPAVAFAPVSVSATAPNLLAVGDFNGDGRADLVTLLSPNTVNVLLGNGNGTFQSPIALPTQVYEIYQILPADVNGDGNLDLVILNGFSQTSSEVLLGNGNGTFQNPIPLPSLDEELRFAAAGDFNGDGKLDLIFCGFERPASILLGNGDGTFTAGDLSLTTESDAAAAADLNGDGFLDVAVAAYEPAGISIFLNDGTGGMTQTVILPAASPYYPPVLADVNGDGVVDLASVDSTYTNVLIYMGNGDGTFQAPVLYSIGALAGNLIPGDFNGDGKLDLIAPSDGGSSDAFTLLLGNGDGTFRFAPAYVGFPGVDGVPADFNGDGALDLAQISAGDKLTVLLQTSVIATPSGLAFPTIPVTTSSQPLSSKVSNISSAPLAIAGLHVTGKDNGAFSLTNDLCSGTTLPSGASCSFSVLFAPTTAGVNSASVTVSDNARVNPQAVPLQGAASEIEVSPLSLNFGTVKVEHASAGQIIAIDNPGTVSDGAEASVSGADPQDFLLESTCPSPIQAGTGCSLFVRFIPTVSGTRTATILVNDPVGDVTFTVTLSGTGS